MGLSCGLPPGRFERAGMALAVSSAAPRQIAQFLHILLSN